jgi:hypothetical protein
MKEADNGEERSLVNPNSTTVLHLIATTLQAGSVS